MTPEELQRILDADPDKAIVKIKDGVTVRSRSAVEPENNAQKRTKTAQGRNTQGSPLEAKFEALWADCGGSALQREYRFDPVRRWRADFAHLPSKTLIEIEGGVEKGGRHVRIDGYTGDAVKYNSAVMQGYRVIRLTRLMLKPEYIKQLVEWMKGNE